MSATPLQHLLHQLHFAEPDHLLVASTRPPAALHDYALDHRCNLRCVNPADFDSAKLGRFDFAVVADYLEHVDKATGISHLARMRNLHSQRIWVLVDEACDWRFQDFLSLGFQRETTWQQDGRQRVCYGYDLGTYNHARSWNNPRFWANPENWNKYWW